MNHGIYTETKQILDSIVYIFNYVMFLFLSILNVNKMLILQCYLHNCHNFFLLLNIIIFSNYCNFNSERNNRPNGIIIMPLKYNNIAYRN